MAEPRADQATITNEAPRSDAGKWATPVRTLTSKSAPAGAMDLNVTGRRLMGAATGFGRLWQKSFWVRLDGASVEPIEVIRVWKERFGDFWPKGQRMFLPATGIAPGEVGLINAKPMPGVPSMATGVLVIYADDESFSFMSPEGHPFAGPLTFSAADDDGVTVVKVDELTRASDPFWELTMMMPIVGKRMQTDVWRATLRNVAKHFGVDAAVEERIVCVDSHRQWSQAKNLWQNAAIRSTLYTFARPFRRR
jgi:hypothetical protein